MTSCSTRPLTFCLCVVDKVFINYHFSNITFSVFILIRTRLGDKGKSVAHLLCNRTCSEMRYYRTSPGRIAILHYCMPRVDRNQGCLANNYSCIVLD